MKILVLRFSSIGDIVLTTPVVRCLKRQLGAEVHFLTKQSYASVLEHNPNVDRVVAFRSDVSEVLPALRRERYDQVIDLHRNLRSLHVKLALRRPSRAFDKLNWQKWLLVRMKIDLLPRRHIVDRYLDTVRHLGVENDGGGLDFYIPADQEVALATLSPDLVAGRFLAFVIGAMHATKRLPEEKIAAVCRQLGAPVVLLGGPAEQESGRRIAQSAGAHVVDACGRLNLLQSASVLRQAAGVIAHDTGLMHIAAALGKKIVSVWGNTVPAFGMYPYYGASLDENISLEVKGLRCRPCSKIGFDRCPQGHFRCMNDQSVEAIAEAARRG